MCEHCGSPVSSGAYCENCGKALASVGSLPSKTEGSNPVEVIPPQHVDARPVSAIANGPAPPVRKRGRAKKWFLLGVMAPAAAAAVFMSGALNRSAAQPRFETPTFTFTIRTFRMTEQGRVAVGVVIESSTEDDVFLRADSLRLVDVEHGHEWRPEKVKGIRPGYGRFTQFAPGVPGIVTLEFYGREEVGNVFDLTGVLEAETKGRTKRFPFTISALTLSE